LTKAKANIGQILRKKKVGGGVKSITVRKGSLAETGYKGDTGEKGPTLGNELASKK